MTRERRGYVYPLRPARAPDARLCARWMSAQAFATLPTSAMAGGPMRHLSHPITCRSGPRFAAVLATLTLALAGCGDATSPRDVRRVLDEFVRAAAGATRLSHELTRHWCPRAARHDGRVLTQREARRCLARARGAWLQELRGNGYDPASVGSGP